MFNRKKTTEELVQETYDLAQENHNILKQLQSSVRWKRYFKISYWIIIISLAMGAYYYIQPAIDKIKGVSETVGTGLENLTKLGNFTEINKPSGQEN
jgi:hypothetical protein